MIAWRELRNRWFADSALEREGFELSVPLKDDPGSLAFATAE